MIAILRDRLGNRSNDIPARVNVALRKICFLGNPAIVDTTGDGANGHMD